MTEYSINNPRRVLSGAAKETLLEELDQFLTRKVQDEVPDYEFIDELVVQRNRIAKFLGAKPRTWSSYRA